MVGKKTISKRLSAMLNIPIIDVDKLIEKAKNFVRHDTPGQDSEEQLEAASPQANTKATDLKKQLQTQNKKNVAPPAVNKQVGSKKSDIPVSLSETELEFQRLGVKLRNLEMAKFPIPDEIKLELIILELKQVIPQDDRNIIQIQSDYLESKKKAEERKISKQKDKDQKEENAKKADKGKGITKASQVQVKESAQAVVQPNQSLQQIDEAIEDRYPYTKGYILVGFPSTYEQAQ